jgi:hypothetical protein
MLPSGRTPSGHVASLLSISLRSVPPGFNRVFQSLVSLTFSFRFMVLVYERHPRLSGLWLAPRNLLFHLERRIH